MLPLESGLAILVPEAEPLVHSFRDKYDPSAAAGTPAHITLLYPFKPPHEIGDPVIEKLNQCVAGFPAVEFSLVKVRRFPGGVLYLAPEPDEPFRRLVSAICDCYPETPPYGGRFSSFVPHLTVAQLTDDQRAENISVRFERASHRRLPIHATAREITLMDTLSGSWQVRTTFAFMLI